MHRTPANDCAGQVTPAVACAAREPRGRGSVAPSHARAAADITFGRSRTTSRTKAFRDSTSGFKVGRSHRSRGVWLRRHSSCLTTSRRRRKAKAQSKPTPTAPPMATNDGCMFFQPRNRMLTIETIAHRAHRPLANRGYRQHLGRAGGCSARCSPSVLLQGPPCSPRVRVQGHAGSVSRP